MPKVAIAACTSDMQASENDDPMAAAMAAAAAGGAATQAASAAIAQVASPSTSTGGSAGSSGNALGSTPSLSTTPAPPAFPLQQSLGDVANQTGGIAPVNAPSAAPGKLETPATALRASKQTSLTCSYDGKLHC